MQLSRPLQVAALLALLALCPGAEGAGTAAQCLVIAARFKNTCPAQTEVTDSVPYASVSAVPAASTFTCPSASGWCPTSQATATGSSCTLARKLCVSCFTKEGVVKMRVQTNGFPTHCLSAAKGSRLVPQNIDYEFNFMPDQPMVPVTPITTLGELSTLSCDGNSHGTVPSHVDFINRGSTSVYKFVGIATNGVPIMNSIASGYDAVYPSSGTGVVSDLDAALGFVTSTGLYRYYMPTKYMMYGPENATNTQLPRCFDVPACSTSPPDYSLSTFDNFKTATVVVGMAKDGNAIIGPYVRSVDQTLRTDACNGVQRMFYHYLDRASAGDFYDFGYSILYTYVASRYFPYFSACWGLGDYPNKPCRGPTCSTNSRKVPYLHGSSGRSMCSAGTRLADGATRPWECSTCSAGRWSAEDRDTCCGCDAGYYSAAGSASCTACPSGTWSAAGASTCTALTSTVTVDDGMELGMEAGMAAAGMATGVSLRRQLQVNGGDGGNNRTNSSYIHFSDPERACIFGAAMARDVAEKAGVPVTSVTVRSATDDCGYVTDYNGDSEINCISGTAASAAAGNADGPPAPQRRLQEGPPPPPGDQNGTVLPPPPRPNCLANSTTVKYTIGLLVPPEYSFEQAEAMRAAFNARSNAVMSNATRAAFANYSGLAPSGASIVFDNAAAHDYELLLAAAAAANVDANATLVTSTFTITYPAGTTAADACSPAARAAVLMTVSDGGAGGNVTCAPAPPPPGRRLQTGSVSFAYTTTLVAPGFTNATALLLTAKGVAASTLTAAIVGALDLPAANATGLAVSAVQTTGACVTSGSTTCSLAPAASTNGGSGNIGGGGDTSVAPVGAIVGGVVGGLVVLSVAIFAVYVVISRRSSKASPVSSKPGPSVTSAL